MPAPLLTKIMNLIKLASEILSSSTGGVKQTTLHLLYYALLIVTPWMITGGFILHVREKFTELSKAIIGLGFNSQIYGMLKSLLFLPFYTSP